jgi:type II secretory pathway pseudopilin PulG
MLTTQQRATPRTPPPGFTLGELVVALMLFSLVGGSILTLVMRQQRFYRSTAEVIKLQDQLRLGASVLPLDLRTISTSDTTVNSAATKYAADIYQKSNGMVEFRRVFGSSLICALRPTAPSEVTLYPKSTQSAVALSSWGITPVVGDSLLILDEGKLIGAGDDKWRAYEVRAVSPVTGNKGCPWKVADADPVTAGLQPDSTPLLFAADTVRQSYRIGLDSAFKPTMLVGAPVRLFRRVRYEVYQAGDRQWYLGYSDCLRTYTTASRCSDVTPLSGPYLPYTGVASQSGLVFAYYDSLGNVLQPTDESRRVARIEVVMRSATANRVARTGSGPSEQYRDSLVLSIGIRNRR